MATDAPRTMRERTRDFVRGELTDVAQDLFVRNGYEATTIDEIAAAAGVSRRTFFRYFDSKDDLVVGKYERFGDRMAQALRDRPADEPLWDALRRVFDLTEGYAEDPTQRERNEAMERIVRSSPSLYAAYLEKLSRTQELVAAAAAERLASHDPLAASAIVGAAFACLQAAHRRWHETEDPPPMSELLDAAMSVIQLQH